MSRTIGQIYTDGHLVAKTIDRIEVMPDSVCFHPWRVEAKLLKSTSGSCLSSATVLVKDVSVRTYAISSRCYGFLFDSTRSRVYDFYTADANSNREFKIRSRTRRLSLDQENAHMSQLFYEEQLQRLVSTIKRGGVTQLNEIFMDAWEHSCVGLFMRFRDHNSFQSINDLRFYYQGMLEIRLIQKFLIQVFNFSPYFGICLYDETLGKLYKFPTDSDLAVQAQQAGISARTYPKLFELLSTEYTFSAAEQAPTVLQYLSTKQWHHDFKEVFLTQLAAEFEPFDGVRLNSFEITSAMVDEEVGVSHELLAEVEYRTQMQFERARYSAFFNLGRRGFAGDHDDYHEDCAVSVVPCEADVSVSSSAFFGSGRKGFRGDHDDYREDCVSFRTESHKPW